MERFSHEFSVVGPQYRLELRRTILRPVDQGGYVNPESFTEARVRGGVPAARIQQWGSSGSDRGDEEPAALGSVGEIMNLNLAESCNRESPLDCRL